MISWRTARLLLLIMSLMGGIFVVQVIDRVDFDDAFDQLTTLLPDGEVAEEPQQADVAVIPMPVDMAVMPYPVVHIPADARSPFAPL